MTVVKRAAPAAVEATRARQLMGGVLTALAALGASACTGATDTDKLPPEVPDPAALHTPAGAMARYHGTLALLPRLVDSMITLTGVVTDELADLPMPVGFSSRFTALDSRQDLRDLGSLYGDLHHLRGQAREARGFLQVYAPDSSPALAGHLLGIEGYAEVFLADVFCSGIPLSTVDFNGDFTLAAGSTTQEVYQHAITLFDSALALTGDSVRLQQLAAVGKGRALLALGQYTEAAATVAAVADDYRYQIILTRGSNDLGIGAPPYLLGNIVHPAGSFYYKQNPGMPSMADQEGGIGLDYRSSNDPRTPVIDLGPDTLFQTMYFPAKYPQTTPVMFTIADGIEARLIEAEAALQGGDVAGWLDKLNHLRQAAWPSIVDCSSGTCGPGASGPLADLTDPGTSDARVDLMFRERAFWLYLTGHRQGDLRRLIREYGRPPGAVYPSGILTGYPGGTGSYGTQIVAPVPEEEHNLNPKYTGCVHPNA